MPSRRLDEESVFHLAREITSPDARAKYLEQVSADDPVLRERVEALLNIHEHEQQFLQSNLAESPATGLFRPITEGPGTIIGPYKLLQQIGEGGFGVVYMAEQQRPVRRKVALKIIKPGMDTREVIARFESERQALALMDHPNIARVLDAGATESGRPYFVMELVKGVPITEYCDKNALAADRRLSLFITVCHAIQHAHQKGVIHRDLKPSNVMVTLHDGQPVPKVIDFGVSKATSQQLTEKTLFTAYGQMIGTPAYMSPEQAEMSGLDIDTRSDLYSLGVLLYELLTGTTPFDGTRLREAGYAEMQRIIREEAPPRPSTRVSTLGEALTVLSGQRSTDPKKLGQLLRGDLDVIVMKALEKERGRRYDTPNAFADDIQRFLNHEAIVARPASAAYRVKKFAQRNSAAVGAISAIAAALLVGTTISTWLAIRESQASRVAQAERRKAEALLVEAVAAKSEAERERDRAEKATAEESNQRKLAMEQKQAAEEAQQAATAERSAAVQERDKATQLNAELARQKEQQRRMLYVAQMNLIQKAWDSDNVGRVRDLLHASRPRPGEEDLRNIEWRYWQHMLHQEERSFKLGESLVADATSRAASSIVAACSRDGTRLATIVSQGRTGEAKLMLKVWDTAAERIVLEKELRAEAASSDLVRFHICFVDTHRVAISELHRPDASELRAAFERLRFGGAEGRERRQEAFEGSLAVTSAVLRVLQLDTQADAFPPLEIKGGRSVRPGSGHFAFDFGGTRCAEVIEEQQTGESAPQTFVQIWDGRTGAPLARVKAPATPIVALALSADGTRVAVAQPPFRQPRFTGPGQIDRPLQPSSPTGQIQIVEVASGNTVATIGTDTRSVMEFSPDGTRLAVLGTAAGRTSRGATIFDTATGGEIFSITGGDYAPPSSTFGRPHQSHLTFSPDQQWLVYNGFSPGRTESASIQLWNAATGDKGPEFKGNIETTVLVAFTADSQRLFSFHPSGTVKVWRLPMPRKRGDTTATDLFQTRQRLTATSPDTRWRASAPRLNTGWMPQPRPQPPYQISWSNELDQILTPSAHLAGPAQQLKFSNDSKLLAAISIDPEAKLEEAAELKVWDLASGKERLVHRFAAAQASRPAFGGQSATQETMRSASAAIEISPASQRLALATRARSIQVWSLVDGQLEFTANGEFTDPQFSPDGKTLLASLQTSASQSVDVLHVWDADTHEVLWKDESQATQCVFSADSKRLAALRRVGGSSRPSRGGNPSNAERPSMVVWDASSGSIILEMKLPDNRTARSLSLSSDGRRLAVVTAGQVTIYDVDTAVALYTLEGFRGTIQSARFTQDGQRIVTAAQSETSPFNRRDFGFNSSPFNFRAFGSSTFDAGQFRSGPAEIRVYDTLTGQELLAGTTDSALLASLSLSSTPRLEPLPAHVQAEELVDLLSAPDAKGRLAPRSEIVRQIEADTSLSDDSRKLALAEVATLRRNASMLAEHAWKIVQSPGHDRDEYERAKELIHEADGPSRATDYPICLGGANYRLGEYAAALTALERGVQLTRDGRPSTNAVDAFFFLAMTQYQLGNAKQARETFYEAELKLPNPGTSTITTRRARGDFGQRAVSPTSMPLESHSVTEAATLLGLRTLAQNLAEPTNLLSDREFSRALAYQSERIRQSPTGSAYYIRFGLWNGRGDLHYALEDIEEAVRLEPRNAIYVNNRAWTLWRMGELDRAMADHNEAERLDEQYLGSYINRSIVWSLKGDYDKALRDLEASFRLAPGNPKALLSRGWLWEKLGQPEKAQADYSAALRQTPFSKPAAAYRLRAELWMERREYDRAIADYGQTISLEPENPDNFYLRGLAWRDQGGYGQAIEDFNKVIQLAPAFPNAYRQIAWILAACPDKRFRDGLRAVETATRAVELTEEQNSKALATLAAACAETGDFPHAVEYQQKALRLAALGAEKADLEADLTRYRAGEPIRITPSAKLGVPAITQR